MGWLIEFKARSLMVSRWVRSWDSRLLRPLLSVLSGIGVTPNMLTMGSLLCLVIAGVIAARGQLLTADVLLLVGGIADSVDGELARQTGSMTSFGGFLDSICDHCGDYAFSLGLIWFFLSRQAETEVILVVVALFGSMLGSQGRSRAGMIGLDTRDVGMVTRFERMVLWIIGIATAHISTALWVLAVLNNLAALQRVAHVVKRASDRSAAAD
jgi:CDP-diacylglycerol--glycerol-3-phosphate 3-phosphatidyltransferase